MSAGLWAHAEGGSVFSQFGEDGILQAIFVALGIDHGYCVEFGASDGVDSSNTHNLVRQGWTALLIEPQPSAYRSLVANLREFPQVTCLRASVELRGENSLDSLLDREPDLLSIDVDGIDYHLWASLQAFSPKVVVVEYNPTIPNDIEFVQAPDAQITHGSSVKSLVGLASEKGYELAATTDVNAIFVRGDLFPALGIDENSLDALRDDSATKTVLFQGYDGTLMLAGNKELLWHRLPIDETRLQVLPRLMRTFPARLPPAMQALAHAWSLAYLARARQLHGGYVEYHVGVLRQRLRGARRRLVRALSERLATGRGRRLPRPPGSR